MNTPPVSSSRSNYTYVKFGKPEVRTYSNSSWETAPLLDSYEAKRLAAKIKAAPLAKATPYQPVQRPKPKYTWWQTALRGHGDVVALGVVATVVACALAGPFGLIVPAVGVLYGMTAWAYRRYSKSPSERAAYQQAQRDVATHMLKLATKYERSGLTAQAKVCRDFSRKYR